MADLDLAAIRDREESATSGPWIADGGAVILTAAAGDDDGMWVIGDATHTEDAEFVAHARSDVPALLERVAELEAERDEARGTVLAGMEGVEAERDAALAVIATVRALHPPIDAVNYGYSPPRPQRVCGGCGQDDGNWSIWPCATIRALSVGSDRASQ